ncbi:MAG: hypothetical protein CSA70_07600 [Rhodobacterales bacterium]|nr:MAG: hypothetical protein CSA70_07600 [Rhodobacterales bacterium]
MAFATDGAYQTRVRESFEAQRVMGTLGVRCIPPPDTRLFRLCQREQGGGGGVESLASATGAGERFRFVGRVLKPGKTVMFPYS